MSFANQLQPIGADTIRAEAETFFALNGKIEHAKVLQEILDEITGEIDFYALAGLDPKTGKLNQTHFVVIAVDEILRIARQLNCGLCHHNAFFYTFNGEFWKQTDKGVMKSFLGEASKLLGVNNIYSRHCDFREKLFKQFVEIANLPKPETKLDKVLINLQNGTFEITADGCKLRSFDRNDFLTYQLPFEYDENADCPKWQAFLDEVLPDKETQSVLAEFFGYVFTHHLKIEKALFLYGQGQNGKGVVFDVINALLRKENITNFSLADLMLEHNRALISDKLLNYSSEANAAINRDIFKNLVSNESIMARLKYGQSFMMTDYAKLAFNCNSLPRETEQTKAYFRRFLIVPFNVTIDDRKKNPNLAKTFIETELSGIFNWLLKGLHRLLKQNDFSECKAADEAVKNYQTESDSVAMFLDDEGYQSSADNWLTLKEFYIAYRAYCLDNGYKALGKLNVSKRLGAAKIQVNKGNGNQTIVWLSK